MAKGKDQKDHWPIERKGEIVEEREEGDKAYLSC